MNGFSLIELLVALAIASIALLGIATAELRAVQDAKFSYQQSVLAVKSYSEKNIQQSTISSSLKKKLYADIAGAWS